MRVGLYFRSLSKYVWIADLDKLGLQTIPRIGEMVYLIPESEVNENGHTYFVENVEYRTYTGHHSDKTHIRVVVLPVE